MKLVIEIPDRIYNEIFDTVEDADNAGVQVGTISRAIANGTPLEEVFEDIRAEIRQKQWHIGVDSANQVIEIIDKHTGGM